MNRFKPTNMKVFSASLSSFGLMVLYGLFLNMTGELLPSIMNDFNLSLSEAGLLPMYFNLGGITTLVILIYFSDKIKKSKLVYFSFLIVSVTLAATGLFVKSYLMLIIAFTILGSSTKIFDVSVNAFVTDINTNGREFFLQLLHTSFGVGAVIGPVYASYIIDKNFGWETAFWFLGAVYIVAVFLSLFTLMNPSKKIEKDYVIRNSYSLKIRVLLKEPQVWILFAGAMCFSGSYVGLVTWFPLYAKTFPGSTGNLSGIILSVFSMGFVLSRITASFILTQKNAKLLTIFSSLIGGVSLLATFSIGQQWAFFTLMPIAGFFAGATLPIIIFIGCISFPHNTGGVTSIMYIGIALLSMIIPFVMGIIGDSFGIAKAMPLTAFLLFAAALVSLFITPPRTPVSLDVG